MRGGLRRRPVGWPVVRNMVVVAVVVVGAAAAVLVVD